MASDLGLLAHSLRLVDLELLLGGGQFAQLGASPRELAVAAMSTIWPGLDEQAANDAWAESTAATSGGGCADLQALDDLAGATIHVIHGLPRMRQLSPLLAGIFHWIDPDILATRRASGGWSEAYGTDGRPTVQDLRWHPVVAPVPGHFVTPLQKRCAELHLHLGGAIPPAALWPLVLTGTLSVPGFLRAQMASGLGAHTDSAEPIDAPSQRSAAMWTRRIVDAQRAFATIVSAICGESHYPESDARSREIDESPGDAAAAAGAAIERLGNMDLPGGGRLWWRPRGSNCSQHSEDGVELGGWFGRLWPSLQAHGPVTGMLAFERLALGFGVRAAVASPQAERAVLTYIRVRNAWHSWLSHRPGSRGLGRFGRSFGRRSFYFDALPLLPGDEGSKIAALEKLRMAQVVQLAVADAAHGVVGPPSVGAAETDLEVRVTAPTHGHLLRDALRGWIDGIAWGLETTQVSRRESEAPTAAETRVGLVFHGIKRPQGDCEVVQHQWEMVHHLRRSHPFLRDLIVGFDMAGEEAGTSPRHHAELFRQIRRDVEGLGPHPTSMRFGLTYHAGEDFRDLLSGVRAVDEAVHQLGLLAGDRIGHGLAITWPAQQFYVHRRIVLVPRGVRIIDLLWLVALLRTDPSPSAAELAFRANEWLKATIADAQRLSDSTNETRERVGAAPIEEAIELLDLDGTAASASARGSSEDHILERFKVRPHVARQLAPAWTRWQPAAPCIARAQKLVRGRLRARGIHIEGCPTSNLIIGDFGTYADLPYLPYIPGFPLKDFGPNVEAGDTLSIIFATDNPGVTGTSLRQEFERVGGALIEAGGNPLEVAEWLDTIRKRACSATFLPRSLPRGAALLDRIVDYKFAAKREL